MQGALNGLSIIFSSQGSLDSIRTRGLADLRLARDVRAHHGPVHAKGAQPRPGAGGVRDGRTVRDARLREPRAGRAGGRGRGRDASPGRRASTRSTRWTAPATCSRPGRHRSRPPCARSTRRRPDGALTIVRKRAAPARISRRRRRALPAAALVTEPEQLRTYECDALTGHRAVPELVVDPRLGRRGAGGREALPRPRRAVRRPRRRDGALGRRAARRRRRS